MKKLNGLLIVIFVCSLLLCTSCRKGAKSLRYLARSANRASNIDNSTPKQKNEYLLSYSQRTENNYTIFTANYLLPKDTALFVLTTAYNMPQKLGFEGKLDSCTVNAFFFKAIADTSSKKKSLVKTITFKANGNFYDIKIK